LIKLFFSYCEYEADEFLNEACSQVPETQTNISERIEEVLKSDPGLYHRILTYEPIWLEEIKELLKESKVKCNPTVLLDYLDDQVKFNALNYFKV
jgi:Slx4 endonuclease